VKDEDDDPALDVTRPSTARMYDYWLGGSANFAADRAAADRLTELVPALRQTAWANRSFLRRAVRYCAGQGIDQFLDLGSGVPTVGNVHEIAQGVVPDAHVVYVDIDPIAVAHSRRLLTDDPNTAVIRADLRDPDAIFGNPTLRGLLDLDRPIATIMVAVLHFIPDADDPHGIVARVRDIMVPGGYVVISHGNDDENDPEAASEARRVFSSGAVQVHSRDREQIGAMFDGFELVPPGLVPVQEWRLEHPDDAVDLPKEFKVLGGVGRRLG
jgi:SAM-dependent methyltransferase